MSASYYVPPIRIGVMSRWLDRMRDFDLMYSTFLFNHLTHNAVVIGCANYSAAEADEKLKSWDTFYTTKDHYGSALAGPRARAADMPIISASNWADHFGDPRGRYNYSYPSYLEYFDAEIRSKGMKEVVNKHYPSLVNGMSACALHPAIHTGFGIEANHDGMVAEGLAAMCQIYHILGSGTASWSPSAPGLIDSALSYISSAQDRDLHSVAATAAKSDEYMAHNIGSFQRIVLTFDDYTLPLGRSLDEMGPIGLPDVDVPIDEAIVEATALMAAAYLASNCEFFYIHGLTSLHAVATTINILEDPIHQRRALVHWWRTLMAVAVCQNIPGVLGKIELNLAPWLAAQQQKLSYPEETVSVTEDEGDELFWRHALDTSLTSLDEHASKAVYVLWRWSQWNHMPAHSKRLFRQAAVNQVRPTTSGEPPHANIWFA